MRRVWMIGFVGVLLALLGGPAAQAARRPDIARFAGRSLPEALKSSTAGGGSMLVSIRQSGERLAEGHAALDDVSRLGGRKRLARLGAARVRQLKHQRITRDTVRVQFLEAKPIAQAGARATPRAVSATPTTPTVVGDGTCNPVLGPEGPDNTESHCSYFSTVVEEGPTVDDPGNIPAAVLTTSRVKVTYTLVQLEGCPFWCALSTGASTPRGPYACASETDCSTIPRISIDFVDAHLTIKGEDVSDNIRRLPTLYGQYTDKDCNCQLTQVSWQAAVDVRHEYANDASDPRVSNCTTSTFSNQTGPSGYYNWDTPEYYSARATTRCYDAYPSGYNEPYRTFLSDDPVTSAPASAGPQPDELRGGANDAAPNLEHCSSGDPVDCASGNLYENKIDLAISTPGPALQAARAYNSQLASAAASSGTSGWGWQSSYTDRLSPRVDGAQVDYLDAHGNIESFSRGADGRYSAKPWVTAELQQVASGGWQLRFADRKTMDFDQGGALQRIADRNANALSLAHNPDGSVSSVSDGAGHKLTYSYTGGLLTDVADMTGRHVTYSYDGSGNLTSVKRPDGSTFSFGYDDHHQLRSMSAPDGTATQNEYVAGRVTSQTVGGRTRKWSYASDGSTVQVTEPDGTLTTYTFADGLVASVTRAAGTPAAATIRASYDASGNLIRQISPAGVVTRIDYNDQGLRTLVATGERVERLAYDSAGNLVRLTLGSGQQRAFSYDERGNVIETAIVARDGSSRIKVHHLAYDARGLLTEDDGPLGAVTKYAYDSAGNRTSERAPNGALTTYSSDALGRVVSVVSPEGNVAPSSPAAYTTTVGYDAMSRPVAVTQPGLSATQMAYDPAGRLTSVKDQAGTTLAFAYNSQGEMVARKQGDQVATVFERDAAGRVVASTDPLGHRTTYTYDQLGRTTDTTDPLGRRTHFDLDADGNRVKTTLPSGQSTSIDYDRDGRPVAISYSTAASPIDINYDVDGRVTRYGNVSMSYDTFGRLKTSTNRSGAASDLLVGETNYGYDDASNVVTIRYPTVLAHGVGQPTVVGSGGGVNQPSELLPKMIVRRTFDASGQMTSVSDGLDRSASGLVSLTADQTPVYDKDNTTSFDYDLSGHLAKVSRPDGTVERSAFDANGMLLTRRDGPSAGGSVGYSYSADLSYDDAGRPRGLKLGGLSLVEPSNQSFRYDSAGRLAEDGFGNSLQYDAAGRPLSIGSLGLAGTGVAGGIANSPATAQTFDAGDQLVSSSTLGQTTAFSYSANGERTQQGAGALATQFGYDPRGLMTSVKGPTGNETWTYDATGLLMTQAGTQLESNTWDRSSDVPQMLSDGSGAYLYGPDGLPVERVSLSRPLYFHRDAFGSTRALTSTAGLVVNRFAYGPFGELLGVRGPSLGNGVPLYRGQYTDIRTGLVYLHARVYDPTTHQFLTRDPLADWSGSAYGYASNSPLQYSDPTGLLPSLQDVSDFAAGFGDLASFGLTEAIREAIGVNGAVDFCSPSYFLGGASGLGVLTAATAGVGGAADVAAVGESGATLRVADLLGAATEERATAKTVHYFAQGGYAQARADFASLTGGRPVSTFVVRSDGSEGLSATLSDGTTISVRSFSQQGDATLQITKPGAEQQIKIRYR